MKKNRLESYIELYQETKNHHVLDQIIHDYGERALLSMGEKEIHMFVMKVLNEENYQLVYELNKIDLLRIVYSHIIDIFFNYNDVMICTNILTFLRNFRFIGSSRFIIKEHKKFITSMINGNYERVNTVTKDEYNEYEFEDSRTKYRNSIIMCIAENPSIDYDLLISICEDETYMFSDLIGSILSLRPISDFTDLMFSLNEVYDRIVEISESYSKKLDVESIFKDGLRNLVQNQLFDESSFGLFYTIKRMKLYNINRHKDIMIKFFKVYIENSEPAIDRVKGSMKSYMADNGIFPLEIIMYAIERYDSDAIWYILYYRDEIKEKLSTYLYFDRTGLEAKLDTISDGFDLLVNKEILPRDFLDITNFILRIQQEEILEDSTANEFNVDELFED